MFSLLLSSMLLFTQHTPAAPPALPSACTSVSSAPIPDISGLLHQVVDHQRQLDMTRENYTYREVQVTQELNRDGSTKKTETEDYDVFFVNTHQVERLVEKDGKALTPDEERKEQDRIAKSIAKAQSTPPGQSAEADTISVTRLLEIMKVDHPRRILLDCRSTIAFDFTGDPHAKAHGRIENLSKKLSGTLWIDEQDHQVRRIIARIDDNFRIGFGLMSVQKGSNFTFDQTLVKNELWLPTGADIHLVAHALGLIGYRANIHVTDGSYEKFHATASQQPGARTTQ
ncbi:hypothetical protein [Paracidobacterium acidisoli]|uniref:Uncharacterized protein n=1 Tax=Paracidobacterium acidisoli TaxID=2303751 RepID=A0A372IP69_9BACT|nr:hypothetical protein [Paracidobacterium acidisoli]MBT9330965.1 hypothetical protein [Paracidobacterium acidisoli]